nr:type II toxin-antitoxin system PemK/MazF family toxin [Bacillota bacterium]
MAKILKTTPNRGEVWLVDLDPTEGAEISRKRPSVVMSSSRIGKLPLRIIVPVTRWDDEYAYFPWMTRISPDKQNGLSKISAADAFQVRSISVRRFVKRFGALPDHLVSNIAKAIALCIDLDLRS